MDDVLQQETGEQMPNYKYTGCLIWSRYGAGRRRGEKANLRYVMKRYIQVMNIRSNFIYHLVLCKKTTVRRHVYMQSTVFFQGFVDSK